MGQGTSVDYIPECRFIVTSRTPTGWEARVAQEARVSLHDARSSAHGFGRNRDFIDHWHLAVAEEVRREDEIGPLERLATNLKITLRQNRAIRLLATNPLLCSVSAPCIATRTSQLPEDRVDLFMSVVVRCCFERRTLKSKPAHKRYPRISYQTRTISSG